MSLEDLVGKDIADQIPAVEMPEVMWFNKTLTNKDDNIHKQRSTRNHGQTNGQIELSSKYLIVLKVRKKKK